MIWWRDLKAREKIGNRNRSAEDPGNGAVRHGLKNSFAK